MRPKRLWSQTSLAVEPRLGPLFVMLAILVVIVIASRTAALNLYNAYSRFVYEMQLNRPFRWPPLFVVQPISGYAMESGVLMATIAMNLIFLQVFRRSIARYRVRSDQVLRVLVLASVPIMGTKAIGAILTQWLPQFFPWSVRSIIAQIIYVLFDTAALLLFIVSLKLGLTDYLKVIRGGWIATLTVALTMLTWVTLVVVYAVVVDRWNTLFIRVVERTWPGLSQLVGRLLGL